MDKSASESCFWSLLSKDDFRFLYIPSSIGRIKITSDHSIKDMLLYRSLFDIMHPVETDLAKADLSRFLKLKVLAGSVTRCRLVSTESLATYLFSNSPQFMPTYHQNYDGSKINSMKWNIIDLVMYTVTENTVLAFFHNYDLGPCCVANNVSSKPNCDQHYQCFVEEDALELINILEQQNTIEKNNAIKTNEEEIHIFQVIDRLTKQPLIVWPQPLETPFIEMIISKTNHITLKEFKNSSFCAPHQLHGGSNIADNISCSHHFYACSKVEIFSTHPSNFQRILIPYGNIIFESLQISSAGPCLPIHYQSNSSSFLSSGTIKPIRPPHASIMEATYRSNSMDGGDLARSQLHQTCGPEQKINNTASLVLVDTSTLNTFEVEKNLALNYKYEMTRFEQHQEFPPSQQKSNQDDSLAGSSMFQKFRIHRYEDGIGDVASPISSTYATMDKRRIANFNYRPSEGGAVPKNMKICASCHTSNSPEWRRGPDGHKTLCNACGLRYSRFKSKQWIANTSKSNLKQ